MITVIGASSCGLFTAWRLAQAGQQVTLYEKEPAFQPYSRRLIVTPYLSRLLPINEDLILHRVDSFEFFANGSSGRIKLKSPDLIIERKDLINCFMAGAQESGVEVRKGWSFSGFNQDRNGGTVCIKNMLTEKSEEISPSVLIGADGPESSVAWALQRQTPTVSLVQAKISLPKKHPPNLVQIWFKRDITPYFFWLFPDSRETGVVGVIMKDGDKARQALDEFINQMGWEANEYESGCCSLYVPELKPEVKKGSLKVLFVGDAIGQVKVTTVGGTVTGLRGAEACIRAITKGKSYWSELAPLRRELKIHLLIRKFLNRLHDDEDYSDVVSYGEGMGSFLGSFSRDEMSPHFFPLFLRHHRIFFKALKTMIRGN